MVLVPQGADQFDNARACQEAGAARVLMPEQVSPEAVREAARAVLQADAPERRAARELAGEIAAMPSAAHVAREPVAIAAGQPLNAERAAGRDRPPSRVA
jgi:UDP:flavonoid glycosyltransferase YjiC (YdhE family)